MMKKLMIAMVVTVLALTGFCSAATFTNVVGSATGYSAYDAGKSFVQEITLNFATTPVASNDVVQLLNIKSNSLVAAVQFQVLTTNNCTADAIRSVHIGDDGSASRYKADLSMGATSSAASGASVWNLYTANNTLDVTGLDSITNGTLRVRVWVVDFSR